MVPLSVLGDGISTTYKTVCVTSEVSAFAWRKRTKSSEKFLVYFTALAFLEPNK
jgi:hypothetical protein